MKLRIYENLRVPSYAPAYIAQAYGCFVEQALSVDLVPSPSTAETAAGVVAGRVDLAFGGPMRVMLNHDQDPNCPLRCFCQMVGPEPFVLVGLGERRDFGLRDLSKMRFGVVSEVPTPWLLLQDDLRRVGLVPESLEWVDSNTMAQNVASLVAGQLDVIQVMEPYTQHALDAGGRIWHRFASRGDVAFTSFYGNREFLNANQESCAAVSRAISQAITYLRSEPADELARALQPLFPKETLRTLTEMVNRYNQLGIWREDTFLYPAAFVRLKSALLSGGFITSDPAYAKCVDSDIDRSNRP